MRRSQRRRALPVSSFWRSTNSVFLAMRCRALLRRSALLLNRLHAPCRSANKRSMRWKPPLRRAAALQAGQLRGHLRRFLLQRLAFCRRFRAAPAACSNRCPPGCAPLKARCFFALLRIACAWCLARLVRVACACHSCKRARCAGLGFHLLHRGPVWLLAFAQPPLLAAGLCCDVSYPSRAERIGSPSAACSRIVASLASRLSVSRSSRFRASGPRWPACAVTVER